METEKKLHLLQSPLIAILLVSAVIAIYVNLAFNPDINIPFLQHARLKFQDELFKARLFYNEHFRKDYPKESVVVLIVGDEESIIKTKRNIFYDREALAKAIEKISECKPKLIVLDLMFFKGKDKSNIVVAEAIKKAGNVIVALDSTNLGLDFVDSDIVAASFGHGGADFVVISDDNILRTFKPSVLQFMRRPTMPIAILIALVYRDILPLNHVRVIDLGQNKHVYTVDNGNKMILLVNEEGEALVNYLYDEKNLPTIPIWKIIEGDFEPKLLEGKIALLAQTAEMYHDIHPTPIGKLPGGVIIANVINSLIHSDFLVEISSMVNVNLVLLFSLGVILAIFFYKTTILRGLMILILTICLSFIISFTLFLNNIVWSASDIIILVSLLYTAILYHKALIWEFESRGEPSR